jgi:MOSC domain-containing protein YiiM
VTAQPPESAAPVRRGKAEPAVVVSVNVGLPREVPWRGEVVRTAILKRPVAGAVRVGRLNIVGDGQADLTVHGGPYKAVYVYPAEHYEAWRGELGELAWGAFGENLTTRGLDEAATRIGDRLRIGTAEFVVTQPRLPCRNLELRFGRPGFEKRFLERGLTGFYLSVAREGEVRAGAGIAVLARGAEPVTVAEVVSLYQPGRPAPDELLRRVSALAALPERMREHFRRQLAAERG